LNRPELTADRFICDPYSTVPGARMYDTGDLAMWRTDGNIEFLGRADDQVKIRGFRVELGEIEAALDEHKGVRQAAVISRGDVPGGRLVAFVVPADPPPEIEDLREYLASRLPEYMQPSTIVLERTLPLTPTGKVNRRALQAPAPARPGSHAFAAPQGDTEETVAAIWAEVLHLDRVGADDNFFELGGHSLVATQLVSRIRQAFDTEFPLRLIFEKPSVRQIAAEVEQRVLRDVLVLPETEARRLVSEEN
jgi:acyl carrier protein